MAVTSWLIDKSAYVRLQLGQAADRDAWNARIGRGLVRLSAHHPARTRLLGTRPVTPPAGSSPPRRWSLMPVEHLTPAIEDRAFEVQMLLADRGQHRAPSIPDLLIAATAEKAGLTVLAVDKDFDLIAAVTGQPVETLH